MGRRRRTTAAAALAAAGLLVLPACRALDEANARGGSTGWKTSKGEATSGNGATARSAQRVYVVQSGDTLYSIAERECGNGESVSSLAAANVGRSQPDGRVMKDPDSIRVGWELVVSCRSTGD